MSKEKLIEEFEKKYSKDFIIKSEPEDYIHKGVDPSFNISDVKQFLSQALDQTREETIESIVKYIRENLTAGESWERGDIYININNVETLGSGSFNWDNEFWDELKNDLLNNLKQ